MAEFVDLGKHCELSSCNRLDYTPFYCRLCSRNFCSSHRFAHGCDSSREFDPAKPSSCQNALRPYICSAEGCSRGESVKIVCTSCCRNYCLSHRHIGEHTCIVPSDLNDCDSLVAKKKPTAKDVIDSVKAKFDNNSEHLQALTCETSSYASSHVRVQKPLSEAAQKRNDVVMAMKLRSKESNTTMFDCWIVFVDYGGRRDPVVVSKAWTLMHTTDYIKVQLGISTDTVANEVVLCSKLGVVFNTSDTVSEVLSDMDSLVLRLAHPEHSCSVAEPNDGSWNSAGHQTDTILDGSDCLSNEDTSTSPHCNKEKATFTVSTPTPEQIKADRVAVMKLKMSDKTGIPKIDQLIIFSDIDGRRQPFVVSKLWTIGRAVDVIFKGYGSIVDRSLRPHIINGDQLESHNDVSRFLKELDTLFFR